mgnify:CR=1 FL=1
MAKKKRDPVYQMTYKELKKYEQRAYQKAIKDNIKYLYALSYLSLRDDFGFGQKRMKKFMKSLSINLNHLMEERFSLTDIEEVMKEEIGLEIFEDGVFMEVEDE